MTSWTLLKSTIAIKFYDTRETYVLNRGKMNLGTYSRKRTSFPSNSVSFKAPSIAPSLLISDHLNQWSFDYYLSVSKTFSWLKISPFQDSYTGEGGFIPFLFINILAGFRGRQ
jgi:hypothetical protein